MKLTTNLVKMPAAKEKHFAPPSTMKNNDAESFSQQSRKYLLMFLLSIDCEVWASSSGLLQNVAISFDQQNNELVVLASWEVPPNINHANFIIKLSSTDFDEENIILSGDQNTWHYEHPLEPGEYKLSFEINVNNGYRYKSATYNFNVTDKTNEKGILISARQTNVTEESFQNEPNYYEYIIPSVFAGALHLAYFISGIVVPFTCYNKSAINPERAKFRKALTMNLYLFAIDFFVIALGPLFTHLYINNEKDETFIKAMVGFAVFIAHTIFVPFSTLAGFSTRMLIEKYL